MDLAHFLAFDGPDHVKHLPNTKPKFVEVNVTDLRVIPLPIIKLIGRISFFQLVSYEKLEFGYVDPITIRILVGHKADKPFLKFLLRFLSQRTHHKVMKGQEYQDHMEKVYQDFKSLLNYLKQTDWKKHRSNRNNLLIPFIKKTYGSSK
mgnify:CR=1 FL=1